VKPRASCLKLNVDAAFNVDDFTGAAEAVIRDNQGNFVADTAKYIDHVLSATMAEA
jgi:methionyl-tRNA synthetase